MPEPEAIDELDILAARFAGSTEPQVLALLALMRQLRGVTTDLRAARQDFNEQREWNTYKFFAICVAIVAVAWLGFRAQVAGNEARDAVKSNKAATTEARIASCLQFNIQQAAIIDGDRQEIRKVVAALTAGAAGPVSARVHTFLVDYDQTVIRTHPLRDCTPGGITLYLRGPTTATPTSTTIPIGAP